MSKSIIKYKYTYDGPVLLNDHLIMAKWSSETIAHNDCQARHVFNSECKKHISKLLNKSCTGRIYLPGKMERILTIM